MSNSRNSPGTCHTQGFPERPLCPRPAEGARDGDRQTERHTHTHTSPPSLPITGSRAGRLGPLGDSFGGWVQVLGARSRRDGLQVAFQGLWPCARLFNQGEGDEVRVQKDSLSLSNQGEASVILLFLGFGMSRQEAAWHGRVGIQASHAHTAVT